MTEKKPLSQMGMQCDHVSFSGYLREPVCNHKYNWMGPCMYGRCPKIKEVIEDTATLHEEYISMKNVLEEEDGNAA